jgi:hypothetical protein
MVLGSVNFAIIYIFEKYAIQNLLIKLNSKNID